MTSYTYNQSELTNGINQNSLEATILETFSTFSFTSFDNAADPPTITIGFTAPLSTEDQAVLLNILNTYTPITPLSSRPHVLTLGPFLVDQSIYQRIHLHLFEGKIKENIVTVRFVSAPDNGVTAYSIRILDITNNQVIALKTDISNTVPDVVDLGVLTNQSLSPAIWEISARVGATLVAGAGVYLYEMLLY